MPDAGEDEEVEFVILNKRDSLVYQIPPASSSSGHKADDWKKCIWRGRCRIVGKGKDMSIKMLDSSSGTLFAQCHIPNGDYSKYVERVTDSSRYFVLKITNGDRHAFIGLGFEDRNDSFDFNVALNDFKETMNRDNEANAPAKIAGPSKDLSLKEGQKISLNLKNLVPGAKKREPASQSPGAGGISMLAPPPPSGQPRRQPAGAGYAAPQPSAAPFPASAAHVAAAPKANTDDLFADFGDDDFQSAGFADFQSAPVASSAPAVVAAPSTDFAAAFSGLAFDAAPAAAPAAALTGISFDAAPVAAPAAAAVSAPAVAAPVQKAEDFDPFTAAFGNAAAALPTSATAKAAVTPGQRPGQKDPFDAFDIFK